MPLTRVMDCKGTTACLDRLRFLRPVGNVQDPEIEKNLIHQWQMHYMNTHGVILFDKGDHEFMTPEQVQCNKELILEEMSFPPISLSLSLSLCRFDRLRFIRPVKRQISRRKSSRCHESSFARADGYGSSGRSK